MSQSGLTQERDFGALVGFLILGGVEEFRRSSMEDLMDRDGNGVVGGVRGIRLWREEEGKVREGKQREEAMDWMEVEGSGGERV